MLDTDAFVLYLTAEEGGVIRRLLREAEDGRARVLMNVFNMAEVHVRLSSRLSDERFDAVIRAAQALPIERISAADALVFHASRIRAHHGIDAARAIAIATAAHEKAILITAEPLPFRPDGIEVRPLTDSMGAPLAGTDEG